MKLQETAYAKINLYLDVLSKRPDGYHNVLTLMQRISLCDILTAEVTESESPEISLSVMHGEGLESDRTNLVWRAAELYMQHSGQPKKVSFVLEKHIPRQAGLGGGSSDAAAALRIMQRACANILSADRLCTIAASLGADVPFFLNEKPCLCQGRGDEITPSSGLEQYTCVLVEGDEGSSTAEAYHRLDCLSMLNKLPPDFDHFSVCDIYNRFTPSVARVCPSVTRNLAALREAGAIMCEMTGSGTAVFGLFKDPHTARLACEHIGKKAHFCHLISDS